MAKKTAIATALKAVPAAVQGRVTLADVAAQVGVSVNTVSRSLRAPQTVRLSLRQRIGDIIDELNYVPNRLAGGLAGSHSGLVGVIVTSLFNSEFALILDTLQQDLAARGMQVMIGNSAYDPDEELRLVRAMLSWRPAAIAIVGTNHHARAGELLRQANVPIVELWDATDAAIDTVIGMDHRRIGRDQCRHLVDGGCARLAYVGSVRTHDYRAQKRLAGVQDFARRNLGRKVAVEISNEPGNPSLGARLVQALLAREPLVDGIICNSDVIALGVLNALRQGCRRVPDDVSVIGFGDNDAGECVEPALTTIRPPRVEIGRLAARAILSRIEGGPVQRLCLDAELVVRGTTRLPLAGRSRSR